MEFPKGFRGDDGGKGPGPVALGRMLSDAIDSGAQSRDTFRDRWNRVRGQYEHDLEEKRDEDKAFPEESDAHLNVMQLKIDALSTQVINNIAQNKPYCHAVTSQGSEVSSLLEKIVQGEVEKARYDMVLRKIGPSVGWANTGIISDEWASEVGLEMRPGVKLTAIDPSDFVVYPAVVSEIVEAKVVGSRFHRRRKEIEELIEKGVYIDVDFDSRPTRARCCSRRTVS